jgi:hypothetical protein
MDVTDDMFGMAYVVAGALAGSMLAGSILFKIREFCLFIYTIYSVESSPPVYLNT